MGIIIINLIKEEIENLKEWNIVGSYKRFKGVEDVNDLYDAIQFYRNAVIYSLTYSVSAKGQADISSLHTYFANKFKISREVFSAKVQFNIYRDHLGYVVNKNKNITLDLIVDNKGKMYLQGKEVDYNYVDYDSHREAKIRKRKNYTLDNDFMEVLKLLNKTITDVSYSQKGSFHEVWLVPEIKITDEDLVTLKNNDWEEKYPDDERINKFLNKYENSF